MRPFEYANPKTKEQAAGLLGQSWGDVEILAGGTDLLALMKDEIVTPKRLVNIKEIPGMSGVRLDPKAGIRIGALVTLDDLSHHPLVREHAPLLAWATHEAASPQIRNLATLGGNLCQRPRCWYFRSGMGLLPKDEKGRSLVVEGDNRYHAILGNDGPAYYVHPSTIAPVLIAYGAVLNLFGPGGPRSVPLERFYVIPKNENDRERDLRPNEIVTEILVPSMPKAKAASYEVRQKEAFDWPLAMASVALDMNGSTVKAAAVVLGHVAPIPWRSREAEQALIGKAINEQTASEAAQAALAKARPLSKNGYKVKLAQVAVKRAILKAAGGAQ